MVCSAPKLGKDIRVVFISDGDQAPPANPQYMPEFSGKAGQVKGFIAGIGALTPSRIPKLDERDNIAGYWELEDVQRYATFGMAEVQSVLQMEGYHGRNAPHGSNPAEKANAHLSALNEDTLQRMAKVTGLSYTRLSTAGDLANAMTATKMAAWRPANTDLRIWLAIPAMLLILLFFLPPKVVIPGCIQDETRRINADSAVARQGRCNNVTS
jgi:mxaL protein